MREPTGSEVLERAWVRLVRAHRAARAAVEADLKAAGFPPLAWYDVLLELARAPGPGLRPFELEKALLLAQYNLSRLVDRMQAAGYVKRAPCAEDARGQVVAITEAGRRLQKAMWPVYRAAVARQFGEKLTEEEAGRLAGLLAKLVVGAPT